jgi:2'-5' RNA ligase
MGSIAFVKRKAQAITSWFEGAMNRRNKEIFNYEFSGISVWIEPDEIHTTNIQETMTSLADKCGGATRGVHEYTPHCTMLYNIPRQSFLERNSLSSASQDLLDECVQKYKKEFGDEKIIVLKPTSLHCFRFRPFGCVISFLHVELTKELDQMHQILKGVFPPDERHQTSGKLQPHMSLVYAPEAKEDFLMDETKRLAADQNIGGLLLEPIRAKYLSVWSTEGKTSDWKRIAKVVLP